MKLRLVFPCHICRSLYHQGGASLHLSARDLNRKSKCLTRQFHYLSLLLTFLLKKKRKKEMEDVVVGTIRFERESDLLSQCFYDINPSFTFSFKMVEC